MNGMLVKVLNRAPPTIGFVLRDNSPLVCPMGREKEGAGSRVKWRDTDICSCQVVQKGSPGLKLLSSECLVKSGGGPLIHWGQRASPFTIHSLTCCRAASLSVFVFHLKWHSLKIT